jgi:hypothetical protein
MYSHICETAAEWVFQGPATLFASQLCDKSLQPEMLLVTCTVNLSGIGITTHIYASDATGDVHGCLEFLREARGLMLSITTDTRREFNAIPNFWMIMAPRSNRGVSVDHSIQNPLKYCSISHPDQRSLTILPSKILHLHHQVSQVNPHHSHDYPH